jgi:hypothetical protein
MRRVAELYGVAFVITLGVVVIVVILGGIVLIKDYTDRLDAENAQKAQTFGVSLPSGAALFETSLQDRITTSDTSMTLVANSLRGSESLSGYNCFTIDEGRSDSEFMCGIVSSTAVTALERGLSFTTGTTSVTALKFAHRKGANVKITDYPLIQRMKAQLSGQDTIPNLLTYSTTTDCTVSHSAYVICTGSYLEAYANNVISGGAPTSTATLGGKVLLASQLQMASSTDLGAAAPLVLQTKYATSAPAFTTGLYAVITRNDGKINPSFIATTTSDVYTFSGPMNFQTSTTTFTGNVSVAATAANPFKIGGLYYAWPTTAAASSSVLTANSTGGLFWLTPSVSKTFTDGTAYTTASTATSSLKIVAVAASTLSTTGQLHIVAHFIKTVDGANASGRYALLFGSGSATTTLVNDVQVADDGNGTGATGLIDIYINNRNSASSQSIGGIATQSNVGSALMLPIGTTTAYNTGATTYLEFQGRAGNASDTWGFAGITITVTN